MKKYLILGATALTIALTVSSCLSFNTHDRRVATIEVTKQTMVPNQLTQPSVVQETTTTRTR